MVNKRLIGTWISLLCVVIGGVGECIFSCNFGDEEEEEGLEPVKYVRIKWSNDQMIMDNWSSEEIELDQNGALDSYDYKYTYTS